MSSSTSNYGLPYPEDSDAIDIAGDIQSLAEACDSILGTQILNLTTALSEQQSTIDGALNQISENAKYMGTVSTTVAEQGVTINNLQVTINEQAEIIDDQNATITELQTLLAQQSATLAGIESQIGDLENFNADLNAYIKARIAEVISSSDSYTALTGKDVALMNDDN